MTPGAHCHIPRAVPEQFFCEAAGCIVLLGRSLTSGRSVAMSTCVCVARAVGIRMNAGTHRFPAEHCVAAT